MDMKYWPHAIKLEAEVKNFMNLFGLWTIHAAYPRPLLIIHWPTSTYKNLEF